MAEKTRAQKTGLGYEVEKKMEQNYDREEAAGTPVAVVNWLHGILGGEHESCPSMEWKDINTYLRDGVVLCKVVNILLKKDGKSPITFQKKVMSPFVAMTNIENFNKGAETYGLAREASFQSGDLWELRKGPFLNVINCIHSLGFVANSKDVSPEYTGKLQKHADYE